MQHNTEFVVSPPQNVSTIVCSARSTLGDEHWKKLVDDKDIVTAADALMKMGYLNTKSFDHAVTHLLNSISKLYVEHVSGTTGATAPAVVFSGPTTRYVPGDYLLASSKPDTTAFISTFAFLLDALAASRADAPFVREQEWTDILSVGEWEPKSSLGIIGQLLWYLSCINRYRPDFKTVYGLFIEKTSVRIMSHTACGSTASSAVPLNDVETWVAFVVHCYLIHQTRDARFESITVTGDGLARWLVRADDKAVATLRPFHAGDSPGRVTWLSFEQDATSPHLASGFLKVSWQDASAQFNEPTLLELAHKGGWLPGLVRHRWAKRDTSQAVSQGCSSRVKEIVHLASIGEPLSKCQSVLHLFKVLFDAIGVHQNLLNEDIIHRDFTWYNLLCDPWHDPETLKIRQVKAGAPSIDFILTGKQSDPCVLVLDLDHGAVMTELYSPGHKHPTSKPGTPMFVSGELSARKPLPRSILEESVLERLQVIDDPKYTDLRKRAFPGESDVAFMSAIADVVERENRRGATAAGRRIRSNPLSPHRPRHDMESLFWVTLWALMRASPIPGCDVDANSYTTLCSVANVLLDHEVGEETLRGPKLTNPPVDALHPVLKRYKSLIADMAMYISIPWDLYETVVPGLPRNHAHMAFRRMLLAEICKLMPGGGEADILFDRTRPRSIRKTSYFNIAQERVTRSNAASPPAPRPMSVSSSGASNSSGLQQPLLNSAGLDAGMQPGGLQSATPQQRLATMGPDPVIHPRVLDDTPSQRGRKRSVQNRDIAAQEAEVDAEEQQHQPTKRLRTSTQARDEAEENDAGEQEGEADDGSRNLDRLIRAFWDDRILWFGVGDELPERPGNVLDGEATYSPEDVVA